MVLLCEVLAVLELALQTRLASTLVSVSASRVLELKVYTTAPG